MKTRYIPITCLYPSAEKENILPLLCISGKWLEKAGFITDGEVSVKVVRHGELIVSLSPKEEEASGNLSGRDKSL